MSDQEKQFNKHLMDQSLEDRLETLLLRGETSPHRLSRAFDKEPEEMVLLIRKIFDRWRQRRIEDLEEIRDLRIEQMNMLMRRSLDEYEKSKQPTIEYTEESRACGFCGGAGKDEVTPGEYVKCKKCGGKGEYVVKRVKTTERQGNPVYLKLAKECIESAANLSGLGKTLTYNAINKIGTQIEDGTVKQEIEMLQYQGAPEAIVAAIASMDLIRNGIKNGAVKRVEFRAKKEQEDDNKNAE